MVILSFAVSTSSKLGLLIAISRNRLGPRLALGVFLRMEYNRNRRFNFVGKGVPLVWSRRKHADCYSDSPADTFHGRPKALVSGMSITRHRLGTVFEKGPQWKNTMPSFPDSLRE